MNHRPYPSSHRARHQLHRHRPRPAPAPDVALRPGARPFDFGTVAPAGAPLMLGADAVLGMSGTIALTLLEGYLALQDYHSTAEAVGIPRQRADEILAQAQGLHAGSTPTTADFTEAHARLTYEACHSTGFRCTGTATLLTEAGPVPLSDVDLRESTHRDFGLDFAYAWHVLTERKAWGGAANITAQHRDRLARCTGNRFVLRLDDGRQAQVLLDQVQHDLPNGTFRLFLHGVGRPPAPPASTAGAEDSRPERKGV